MCITPLQKADDLFWMYTTVAKGSRAMAISNDLLRDHHVEMKIPLRLHERWKQSKIHNFDVTGVVPTKESPRSAPEVTIMPSAAYSREIQASDTTWSIPASTGELWLTLPKRPQG